MGCHCFCGFWFFLLGCFRFGIFSGFRLRLIDRGGVREKSLPEHSRECQNIATFGILAAGFGDGFAGWTAAGRLPVISSISTDCKVTVGYCARCDGRCVLFFASSTAGLSAFTGPWCAWHRVATSCEGQVSWHLLCCHEEIKTVHRRRCRCACHVAGRDNERGPAGMKYTDGLSNSSKCVGWPHDWFLDRRPTPPGCALRSSAYLPRFRRASPSVYNACAFDARWRLALS